MAKKNGSWGEPDRPAPAPEFVIAVRASSGNPLPVRVASATQTGPEAAARTGHLSASVSPDGDPHDDSNGQQ